MSYASSYRSPTNTISHDSVSYSHSTHAMHDTLTAQHGTPSVSGYSPPPLYQSFTDPHHANPTIDSLQKTIQRLQNEVAVCTTAMQQPAQYDSDKPRSLRMSKKSQSKSILSRPSAHSRRANPTWTSRSTQP